MDIQTKLKIISQLNLFCYELLDGSYHQDADDIIEKAFDKFELALVEAGDI